ncbi:DUF397 domain-containing protein [Streptomyces sp. 3MP-14]|uniref:DUF397 domain-containing protein n=1 Tax=Streptomyces mimosae TaxID=2586635 RepID=A0A5N6ABU7_9ACTN|nr:MULTISPECIES: DUF397 domain-containing protein [Streptomyces]KAB8165240.1 DUF397 domain-containing protein [Streptomyces mimosae]KAB8175872.1 DUF397 domain-containing protein [Streptomyces sp. 3MP-14]
MIRHHLPVNCWRSSSYSEDNSECVEIQTVEAGDIAVGDSKDRARGAFVFAPTAWTAFVNHLKNGPVPD